jgi:hypothetical protein
LNPIVRIFKEISDFIHVLRFKTTLNWHQKATRARWYKKWHEKKYSHALHVATAVTVFVLVLFGNILPMVTPSKALAANGTWSQTSFTGTDGTYTGTMPTNGGSDISLTSGYTGFSNANGGSWSAKRPITVNNPNGALTDYQTQVSTDVYPKEYDSTDPSLKLSYHFDEGSGSGINDLSGNGNNGAITIGGTGTQSSVAEAWTNGVNGRMGGSLNLDGTDDLVTAPLVTTATTNVSLESWVYWKGTSSVSQVLTMGNMSGNGFGIMIGQTSCAAGNNLVIHIPNVSCNATSSTYVMPTNQWVHVALTRDATTWKLYANGALLSGTSTSNPSAAPAVANLVGSNFNGQMDLTRQYTRVLTPQEIADHASLTYGVNAGLTGSWHFNEGSGSIANDMSGNNNVGAITGTSYWTSGNGGKYGEGLNASGDDYVSVASTGIGGVNTRELWFKPGNVTGSSNQYLMDMGAVNVYWIQLYDVDSDGKLEIRAGAGSTTYVDSNAEVTSTSTWYHVVVTMNSSNLLSIYVNGVYDNSGTKTAGTPAALKIGAAGDNSMKFTGVIDEVKIYGRALAAVEVSSCYGTLGSPKVRSDYADLRFSSSDGYTEYSYWLESDKKAWVKIPSLANGNNTINMYYGNPSAASSSNPDSTMIFSDNIENGNLSKWSLAASPWTTTATSPYSGQYSATGIGAQALLSKNISANSMITVSFAVKYQEYELIALNTGYFGYYTGSAYANLPGNIAYTAGTWYRIRGIFDCVNKKYKIYINDTDTGWITNNVQFNSFSNINIFTVINGESGLSSGTTIDNVNLRSAAHRANF